MSDLFTMVIEERIRLISQIIEEKNKEYAVGGDRFHNFNEGARVMNTSPELALKGYMMKQLVSVFDLIERFSNKPEGFFGNEYQMTKLDNLVMEKIGDTINYLIILEAMMASKIWIKQYDPNQPESLITVNIKTATGSFPFDRTEVE